MPKGTKDQQFEDGWVQVGRGKRAPTSTVIRNVPAAAKDVTLDSLTADYTRKRRTWQQSSCRSAICRILDRQQPDDGWPITKAVCLASGSLSRDNWECSKRSMFQFVAFIDVVQHLEASTSTSIHLFAQDPQYTALDGEFLAKFDVEMLHIPEGITVGQDLHSAKMHIGPETLVFEFFMEVGPKPMHDLLDSDMHVYIGTSFREKLIAQNGKADRGSLELRYKEFQKKYESRYFPRFEEDSNVFEGLMIHWKEPGAEEDSSPMA